jgi:hypothetical protein
MMQTIKITKMDIIETGFESEDWIRLAQDRNESWGC